MKAAFNQPAPTLGNQFHDDRVLRSHLRRNGRTRAAAVRFAQSPVDLISDGDAEDARLLMEDG